MNQAARTPARRSWHLLIAALVAVAVACALGAWRPWTAPAQPIAAAQGAVAAPAPLALPKHPAVLIFGDSWTYGSAATVPTLGYAYLIGQRLGWNTTVDGVRGSGYLKPGTGGGSYGERIAALDRGLDPDLVIVEGSINDRTLYPRGYRAAVTSAWDALAAAYPHARIVILGPAPQVLPVQRATARIDADLADFAAARGWWYVSPVRDEWITPANYGWVIDTSALGRDHPSDKGHEYLAQRLAQAIAAMSRSSGITAEGG